MIPGLLQGRAATATGGGPVAAPSYVARRAYATGISSASATATFSLVPDGTWSSTGTGYTDESGSWYLPTTAGAGSAYEFRMTPTLVSGPAAVITNPAATWVSGASAKTLQATMQRFTSGLATSSYSVLVEARLSGGAVVSSASFDMVLEAYVGTAGGGGPSCPTLDMLLPCGRRAADIEVGDVLYLADHETGEEALGRVTYAATKRQACVELVTSGGHRLSCSATAPIATREGLVPAPLLLGRVAILKINGLRVGVEIVEVNDLGDRDVRHITVGDRCFWVGAERGALFLHHNAKNSAG